MSPCASCGVNAAELAGRCGSCGALLLPAGRGTAVVIAHASDDMVRHVAKVLLGETFSPLHAKDGHQALAVLARTSAPAMVLDVGLDGLPAFQVIDRVRGDQQLCGVKIVLIASVFDHTAYKRRPKSLYGADDYVEQHHIPDKLPTKLGELLGVNVEGRAVRNLIALRKDIQRAEVAGLEGDAAAIARRIVADIALYHQADVLEGVAGRTTPTLRAALDEARLLLAQMLGAAPARSEAIDEAWRDLLATMTGVGR